jgi:hypothetical protein
VLTVRSFGILLRERGNRAHLAVLPLAAQPAEEGAFELLGVEAVGLGAPVLTRHRHARGMNDMGFDTARSQPAGEPEAVPAGLEGDRNTIDLVPGFLCLCPPSLEQFQQSVLVGRELLQRLAFQAR